MAISQLRSPFRNSGRALAAACLVWGFAGAFAHDHFPEDRRATRASAREAEESPAPKKTYARPGRRTRRLLENIDATMAESPEDLEKQAEVFASEGNYKMAVRRYEVLRAFYPDYRPDEDLLLLIAGLQYEDGEPAAVMFTLETLGEKYPDSQKMARAVELAFAVGKNFVVTRNEDYDLWRRESYAIKAFEFVAEHDPYGPAAAEGLFSAAHIHMRRGDCEEAVIALKDLEKKQPGTPIAAKAEVALGESYLGLNKGETYSRELVERGVFYLEDYLERYPNGEDRERAKALLTEARRRIGIHDLDAARFYCSQRKWTAAKFCLEGVLADATLAPFHPEARELAAAVEKKRAR